MCGLDTTHNLKGAHGVPGKNMLFTIWGALKKGPTSFGRHRLTVFPTRPVLLVGLRGSS